MKTDHTIEIPFKKQFKIKISREKNISRAKNQCNKALSHLRIKTDTVTVQRKCNVGGEKSGREKTKEE